MTNQYTGKSDRQVDAVARELASDADLATIWAKHAPGLPSPRQVMTIEQATAPLEEDELAEG